MLSTSIVQDGSGRVHVEQRDDQGEPQTYNTPVIVDFSTSGVFQELLTVDFKRNDEHGSFRLGTMLLSAHVNPGVGFEGQLLALEVLVVGYVGTSPTVIKRVMFGALAQVDTIGFTDDASYDAIGISGRQMVDGQPNGTATVQALTLQVSVRMTR